MAIELLKRMQRNRKRRKRLACSLPCVALFALSLFGSETDRKVLIRDITQIEGVRDNQLVGYGW
jgi:flagellar basal body P-ring protein FlgI